jgi:oligopeptide transport system substrate-binding protein
MNRCKRIAALVLSAILSVSLLTGCGENNAEGMALSVSVGSRVTTLDPIYAEDLESQNILVHLYENLLRVVPDGNGGSAVVNGMAKDVDVEENVDGTVTYTFRLRSAKWSDGVSVKAQDFVYAWQRLVNPASHAPYATLLSVVVGYQEARNSGDMSLLQVIAKNDTTLEVTLNGNYDWFLNEVCTSPATMPLREDVVKALKEAGTQTDGINETNLPWWADPTALVTNGPYLAAEYDTEYLKLSANGEYTSSQNGPASIRFLFSDSAEEAWVLYEEGEVDAVWPLPEAQLSERAEDENWSPIPELSTYAVVYHSDKGVFSDPLIRQAFAMVIDRNALMEVADVTAVAAEGLVPPGVPENEEGDFRTEGGSLFENDPELYGETCQQAREVLNQAGYMSGWELGELEYLYLDEGHNGAVAEALCEQWESALMVRVTPRGVTSQELWSALRAGEYTLAGVNLEAPGNDAECFLMQWTSDAPNNVVHYENSAYDTLMTIIAKAADGTARMGCLHDAEALLLEDYALSPLYTKGTDWELRDDLMGAVRDARGWFSFANVVKRPV